MILVHGTGDPSSTSESSLSMWEAIWESQNRDRREVDSFMKLYMVPRSGHCGTFDPNEANHPPGLFDKLLAWVENGTEVGELHAKQGGMILPKVRGPMCVFPF